jgi:hypothetical protein
LNRLLKRPPVYHKETAEVLKTALHEAKCESGIEGVALMDVEINRAIKFLQISNDIRQHQRRVGVSFSIVEYRLLISKIFFRMNQNNLSNQYRQLHE